MTERSDETRAEPLPDIAVEVIGLNKWYGEFHVLRDVNLKVARGERIVIFARALTTAEEKIETVMLREARPEMADMRTLVIVGSSATRRIGHWVYAPRHAR